MGKRPLTVFFSVGEPSGDLHGANLIAALRQQAPTIRLVGFGGPRMRQAGMTLLADLTQLAVMWIVQAALNLHKFFKHLRQAEEYFREERPDAVVLIDFPGFNWWVARKARKHGIPVFYYGVPQLWAWGRWRIRKMQRLVDHVLCKLPFEAEWYRENGCRAVYLGHPYFDELVGKRLDEGFLSRLGTRQSGRLVTILPGSRVQEVKANFRVFLKAAEVIVRRVPSTRFAVASFDETQAEMARKEIADFTLPIEVHVGRTGELIQASHCCMACSGSVSLELMYYLKPSVISYRVKRGAYLLMRHLLIRVKYITLVNLLACDDRFDMTNSPYHPDHPDADRVPFPEYPACDDKSEEMAAHVVRWLNDAREHERRVRQLADLKGRFGTPGATRAAAEYILDRLRGEAEGAGGPAGERAA